MNEFLTTTRVVLTPLAPIHIGADEDFEPTNYVIENKVLYGFNPVAAVLTDELRNKLGDLGNKADLMGIQRFFRQHSQHFTPYSQALIPVAAGVAKEYEDKIGKVVQREANGNQVINQLAIQRTSYNPLNSQPYIPASSLKGALRTALLDWLNNGKAVQTDQRSGKKETGAQLEKRLLQGDFHTSPLRLLKIADLMPANDVARKIIFALNHKKRRVLDPKTQTEVTAKGVAVRKEVILHGQYRHFSAEAVLQNLMQHANSKDAPALKINGLKEIAQCCNDYYRPKLRQEMTMLNERNFCDPAWYQAINRLLQGELKSKLDNNQAFLIRLGRYGSAETKTLNKVAQIKIMQGKGMIPLYLNETKTVWLVGNTDKDTHGLLPFGWALVEINPQQDLPELKAWCVAQVHPDMTAIRAQHIQARAEYALEKQQRIDAEKQKAAEAEAHKQAEQARLAALANMTDNQRAVTELADAIAKRAEQLRGGKEKQNGDFHSRAKKLVDQAKAAANWTDDEKTALKNVVVQNLSQVVEGMSDAKEQRKRFKLNDL